MARAARRRLSRAVGARPRVSAVLEGAGSLDVLARRLPAPAGRRVLEPTLELLVVCGPDVSLPSHVAGTPVARSATVDAAVAAATGDYLVLAGASDALLPEAWPAMVAVLQETGSDLVLGDARGPAVRGWAPDLFGRRRLRQDAASCPLALVDLSPATKMFRLDLWRRASIRVGPGGLARSGMGAVMAAYLAADGFDVLPHVVAESTARDGSLPVAQQARFRPPVLAAYLHGLRDVAAAAPAGWRELAATHLLPPLYVDAVGGGEPYFAVLTDGVGAVLSGVDPAGVPVGGRLGAWVAQHGTLHDDALLQDLLADHPHGLPVSAGLVPLPDGLSVDVPEEWRAIRDVDRTPRVWVAARALQAGTRCLLAGASFTEYVDEAPLPAVSLLLPDGPVPLDVERRHDPRTNEWAARAWEDRSSAGWSAWFDASLLPGDPARPAMVEVESSGGTTRHHVEHPALPGPAVRVEVEAVAFRAGVLSLAGTTAERELSVAVSGPRGDTARIALDVTDGRFDGAVELSTVAFGEPVRLPVGRYDVRLEGTGGTPAPARWSAGLLAELPELVDERQRVTLAADGPVPALRVRAPLRVHERGAFAQRSLQSRVLATGTPTYHAMVLLESFRGRSVGDNPGAICSELLIRDLGLDLVWVVDDPGVVVPPGTRAVARRSEAWYAALANAHAYVANAGAPYWFAKKPSQIHLQTWHGTPLKRIGEDRGPGDFSTWRHRRRLNAQAAGWDALLSPGPWCSDIFRSAFGYQGSLWEVGYPRNDLLLGAEAGEVRARVRRRLGLEPGERAVLYAPTWRSHLGERESKPLFLDAGRLTRSCPEAVVLVRGHYTASQEPEAFAGHARVRDVTRYPEIAELYLAADVLVTDYSSAMFDYVLTDKPVILLTPDLERYREVERGFYVDLEEHAPGPLTTTTDGVVEALSRPDADAARRARFRARFCPVEEGRSAAQTVDRLLELW